MDNFIQIAISPEREYPAEAEKIIYLLNNGITYYHIRKPEFSINQIRKLIENIPSEFYSRLALHSCYELVSEFNLGGLHLPEKCRLQINDYEHFFTPEIRLSTSIHTLSEPQINKPYKYSYVFLSPIFNSITKVGYNASFKNEELLHFNQNSLIPIIALGGVTNDKIGILKNLKFSGAALHGSLFS